MLKIGKKEKVSFIGLIKNPIKDNGKMDVSMVLVFSLTNNNNLLKENGIMAKDSDGQTKNE